MSIRLKPPGDLRSLTTLSVIELLSPGFDLRLPMEVEREQQPHASASCVSAAFASVFSPGKLYGAFPRELRVALSDCSSAIQR